MLKQNKTTESGHQLGKISVTPVNGIGLCQMTIFHAFFFFPSFPSSSYIAKVVLKKNPGC